jgi:polysaccharide chain length determinant protein (PEP-CTERM system associated)
MLPGKTYTPEDLVRLVVRRIWLIGIPFVLGTALAFAAGKYLPNKYRSDTLIMVVPQQIPESYVKSTVTTTIEDRLATLSAQILSRSRLERIILDLDLYPSLRQTLPMEDVVERMRKDIDPIKVEGGNNRDSNSISFHISYVSQDAKTAQKATERIASLYIEENLRDRENMAEDTNQFLDSQLEDAKRRLGEQEKKLEEYRNRNSGELPSQAANNLQAIQNLQVQVQALADTADRMRDRRLLLERQLIDLQSDPAALMAGASPTTAQNGSAEASTLQLLKTARERLNLLLAHAKPDHPDVKALQRTIRDLEAKQEAEGPQPSAEGTPAEKPATLAEGLQQKRIRDLKADLSDIDRQLVEKQDQEKRLRAAIAEYQTKLDALPKRETELVELTRDYSTLQTAYQSLLAKREDSKIAANLERRNIGEQFRVLDPARVPERPFSPIRWQIDLAGAVAGLGMGVFLVGFLEYRDSSINSEAEVVRLFNLPVLALVPLMVSAEEIRARRRRTILVSVAVVIFIASAAGFAVWKLRLLQ